jgi:hypothetical protein
VAIAHPIRRRVTAMPQSLRKLALQTGALRRAEWMCTFIMALFVFVCHFMALALDG